MCERLDGSVVRSERDETVCPMFVNEAAYSFKNGAMSRCMEETRATGG